MVETAPVNSPPPHAPQSAHKAIAAAVAGAVVSGLPTFLSLWHEGAGRHDLVVAVLWGVVAAVVGSGVTGVTTYQTRNVALPPGSARRL